MNIDKTKQLLALKTGLADIKLLPQNIHKNSRPANFARKYANGDPNSIIWIYHPKKRYLGFFVRKDLLKNSEIANWVNERSKRAKEVSEGNEYRLLLWA